MYRVLLISDDEKLRKQLKSQLSDAGFQVQMMPVRELQAEETWPARPDLLLLDGTHASTEVGHWCHTLKRRATCADVPLILLIAEALLKQLDWRWGFEEYLALPASTDQLISRLHFVLWRTNRVVISNGLKVGDLAIDFEQFTVSVKGRSVELTFKEYELLRFLASHPGKVFTREVLLNKVWGYDYYGGTRTVDVHVRRLRSKLEDAHHTFIDTIRHVGYKFLPPQE